MPRVATTGSAGTLKFRGKFGSFFLKIQTARQTMVNANKVPKLVISESLLMGSSDATIATTIPMAKRFFVGVLRTGCSSLKNLGISPSFDIPIKIRDCPIIITMITEISPTVAAIVMIYPAQLCPAISNA